MKIDLHTHSTASDGTLSPTELVGEAHRLGIKILALTDHDTINGLEEAKKAAENLDIRFIRGIEMKINFPGQFHLLGLDLARNLGALTKNLEELKNSRKNRNLKILAKINAAGIEGSYEDIIAFSGGGVVGKPHFAQFLISRGAAQSIDEAFKRCLDKGCPFYAVRKTLSVEDGISLVKKAGALAVLAHPISLKLSFQELESRLLIWKEIGLDGIEVFHPDQNKEYSAALEEIAKKHGFLITGGSDFHGSTRKERKLGMAAPGIPIPDYAGSAFL